MSTVVPRTITTHPRVSDRLYRGVLTAGALAVVLILGLITYDSGEVSVASAATGSAEARRQAIIGRFKRDVR